jgi:hypothetical protein
VNNPTINFYPPDTGTIRRWGNAVFKIVSRKPRSGQNALKREKQQDAYRICIAAEWAVARELRADWKPNLTNQPDPGYDLCVPATARNGHAGETINVRGREYRADAYLMTTADKPVKSDWCILALVSLGTYLITVEIAGICRGHDLNSAPIIQLPGQPPSHAIHQRDLTPWSEWISPLPAPALAGRLF